MKTVVITDGKYRSSIAAARTLGRAGYHVVVTQTRKDVSDAPPVFRSRYVAQAHWLEGSVTDPDYAGRLRALLCAYNRPVLLCIGAVSLNTVAALREDFSQVCDFLIGSPNQLDDLNDKELVHSRCMELGIRVPAQFAGEPCNYPVVIKPHCGEKFGLKAADRYAIAHTPEEYAAAMERMRTYDPAPIVQEKVSGDGAGVSLLLDANSRLIGAICHRRIREYPITGGPSACCISFYDEHLIEQACKLLQSFRFTGFAMVEFKGDCVLEVNPRIWGSFPLTQSANSPIVCRYAQAASGAEPVYTPCDYTPGVRMHFLLNDALAVLSHLRRGHIQKFCIGVLDFFRAREALADPDDPAPFLQYLRQQFSRRSS